MEINQSAFASSGLPSASSTSKELVSSDFDTFLKMMTTQVQNQDPLDPVDSADYAVQLATFSSVEQQVKTNDLLVSLAAQMGGVGLTQAAQWVGMEARVAAPAVFDGLPITLAPNPVANADQTRLIVKDASGNQVQANEINMSSEQIEWAGIDQSGNPLPNGTYSFELESLQDGKVLATTPMELYSEIIEVRGEGGVTVLITEAGSKVDVTDISAVRRAD
jgi:flagellar basal-body rod modification protein FlgD